MLRRSRLEKAGHAPAFSLSVAKSVCLRALAAVVLGIVAACANPGRGDTPPEPAAHAASPIRRIASLDGDDFADLQFLKPLLQGRRVVMLGESAHGTAEFSTAKTRLIRFLHREMGFDVIAFESSMSGCDAANRRIGELPPVEVMRACTFGTWHTREALGLFEYLDAERKSGRRLDLAGFDVQNSSDFGQRAIAARFEGLLELVAPEFIPDLEADEQALVRGYSKGLPAQEAEDVAGHYEAIARILEKDRGALSAGDEARERAVALSIRRHAPAPFMPGCWGCGPRWVGALPERSATRAWPTTSISCSIASIRAGA